jgi:hypothetical protein
MNDQYTAHVGYTNTNINIARYFSEDTIKFIQKRVFNILSCTFPQGVLVPCDKIVNVLNEVYRTFRPPTGDIYSRFTIPSNDIAANSYLDNLVNQTITIIVQDVRNNLLTEKNNQSLSIWTTVLGDFNNKGLRSYAPIKLREKRPQTMLFNMNY